MALAPAWWPVLVDALAAASLDVLGVADAASLARCPVAGARAVVVIGSGRPLWDDFVAWVRASPERAALSDPLDAFVAERVRALPPVDGTWIRCAADEGLDVDFRTLAVGAGLGWASRLGLVLHPERGPWIGLRAALFTSAPLAPTGPLVGDGPCVGCAAPCASACPAGALTRGAWEADVCLPWRAVGDPCRDGCHARAACVVGRDHAYSAAQHAYHQDASGRAALLRRVALSR